MGLVSATEMLKKAKAGHYGVGQFNINNLEWTKSILLEAQELNAPVILGVSEGAAKYMTGFTTVAAMVKAMVESLNITVPVALHLDHGSYEGAKAALEAGFTSIMFDGSHYSIEENIEKTKELVELCHAKGVSIEAEVGSIGGEEDGVIGMGEVADPKECKMIADLGVDFLAAGIGNIHGVYPANWAGLQFEALDAIQKETGILPLVLHACPFVLLYPLIGTVQIFAAHDFLQQSTCLSVGIGGVVLGYPLVNKRFCFLFVFRTIPPQTAIATAMFCAFFSLDFGNLHLLPPPRVPPFPTPSTALVLWIHLTSCDKSYFNHTS